MRYIFTSIIAILSFLALVLFTGHAHAQGTGIKCDAVQVTVLPFEPDINIETSFAELQALAHSQPGDNTVGAVITASYLRVEGCTVTIGYTNPVLYIAKELMRDQCSREHVFAHEQTHVRIYQTMLAHMAEHLRARGASGYSLFEAGKAELRAVRALHDQFDSPEEYHRNLTVCNHRIPRILNI